MKVHIKPNKVPVPEPRVYLRLVEEFGTVHLKALRDDKPEEEWYLLKFYPNGTKLGVKTVGFMRSEQPEWLDFDKGGGIRVESYP